MKKFLFLVMVALAVFAMVGCKDDPVAPKPPVEPEPVPPTWEEVVEGKFWQVSGIEKYQDTRSLENPYRKDICMYWSEDTITFWEDANDDGLLSPSEQVNGVVPYELVDGVLTIDGLAFSVSYFNATGWAIEADVTGTTLGDWLGGSGEPYEGWVRIHYVPCMLGFDGNVYEGGFAFVFDDMGDTTAEWVRYKCLKWLDIDFDFCDGFYFTSGTPIDSYLEDDPILGNHIIIISYHDGYGDDIDTAILIANEEYGFDLYAVPPGFKPDHVYDMVITVDSADVAEFDFTSRVNGHNFSVDAVLDRSEMGAFIIRGVDDADAPVVNP